MKPLQATLIEVVTKESTAAKKIVLGREYYNTFSSRG